MAKIEGEILTVIERSEWVAIATVGPDGPHLSATWGDYIRALGIKDDTVLVPAGGLRKTRANIAANPRVEMMFASRDIPRSGGKGQGCVLAGRAEFVQAGPAFDAVKAQFAWARGALVVHVDRASTQL